ncbi:MAG: polysaccharide deacetylase family protein [Clostridia bacterium]|nr:polysaccharide deacetylase family protein [Clostridia bacterium]
MERMKRAAAALLALTAGFLISVGPHGRAKAEIYRKSETEEKMIALTFDDGPSKQNTREILSILEEYGIRATFFVIGENAAKDPERVKSIFEAGHELGNHTYTHAYISKISKEALEEEILKTEEVLLSVTGEKPRVFRPPGGYYDDASLSVLEKMGYKNVLWSLDTRDWSLPKTEKIVSKVEDDAGCGDIILFHDLEDKRLPTPQVLKRIIPYLLENGYEFVTVSELLSEED